MGVTVSQSIGPLVLGRGAGRPRDPRQPAGRGELVWYLLDHLAFGLQLHAVRTTWEDPALGTATLRGAVASSQLEF